MDGGPGRGSSKDNSHGQVMSLARLRNEYKADAENPQYSPQCHMSHRPATRSPQSLYTFIVRRVGTMTTGFFYIVFFSLSPCAVGRKALDLGKSTERRRGDCGGSEDASYKVPHLTIVWPHRWPASTSPCWGSLPDCCVVRACTLKPTSNPRKA